jgi:hypothetical protein
MPRVNHIQERAGSDNWVQLNYQRARLGVRQFGGGLYALAPNQAEHVWGLIDPSMSLCNRRSRTGAEQGYQTGKICGFCFKRLPPLIGPVEGE